MILLHRISVFIITALAAGIFFAFINGSPIAFAYLFGLGLVGGILLARMLGWEYKSTAFWIFLLTPFFVLSTAVFFFLFLEDPTIKWMLGIFTVFGIGVYLENLFTFYHLPGSYQAYALEYVSLTLYIASVFFFTSGAYGAQLFMSLPIWVPALAVFWVMLATSLSVFWVSKVHADTSIKYALSGAVCLTEMYMVLAWLPTSFITNAAAFTVLYYVFLGLTRAHVLDKLTKPVLQRYAGIGFIFLVLLFVTTDWT